MTKFSDWFYQKFNWPRRLYDEKTNSDVRMLWGGRLSTGWGRPARGEKVVNRIMVLGRPYVKAFGKWQRLRPGQPTKEQVAASVMGRATGMRDAINMVLGKTPRPRGMGKMPMSKPVRNMLTKMLEELDGIRSDAMYLIPQEKEHHEA